MDAIQSSYRINLIIFTLFALMIYVGSQAQIGINTTNPKGILDIQSSTAGVVLPRLSLTSTQVAEPAVNPQGGNIPAGSVVYNTAFTANGSNDVSPGMYVWTGSEWTPQFDRKQYALYESQLGLRTEPTTGRVAVNIPDLTNESFTPSFTGLYKILISVNYGGGNCKIPNEGNGPSNSDADLNIARASGQFDFNFDGAHSLIPVAAYSTNYGTNVSPRKTYFAIWQEFTLTKYVHLTAGVTNSFNMSFIQDDAPEFISEGQSTGRGYVAYDLPCRVELIYMGQE
jgi:hypothetical protein